MEELKTKRIGLICSFSIFLFVSVATAEFFGPTPYLRATDSPFNGLEFTFFEIENFEDAAFNVPGVNLFGETTITFPNVDVDSVDADDGSVDGFGNSGRSLRSFGSTVTFTFIEDTFGQLPTHAGIVWTDAQNTFPEFGIDDVEFEAFDPGGASLGTINATAIGDRQINGQTDEDLFFGVSDLGGISQITITSLNDSTNWEMDHLQFGAVVIPEPSTYMMFVTIMLAIGISARIYHKKP